MPLLAIANIIYWFYDDKIIMDYVYTYQADYLRITIAGEHTDYKVKVKIPIQRMFEEPEKHKYMYEKNAFDDPPEVKDQLRCGE
jgi:hypothetical protein